MVNIEKLLQEMTIEEKIGQLIQCNANLFIDSESEITGPDIEVGLKPDDLKIVGSILNYKTAEEMCRLQKKHMEEDRNHIPMLFMMDVIHGYRTIYPIPLGLACSFDANLVRECSKMAAKVAAAGGTQVTFAPMVDYVRDARWGRVMESCGEEPMLNSMMGAAQIEGYHGKGLEHAESLATCVKHFAAYGGAEAGRDYNQADISEQSLRTFYLPAYKACLDAGADMLMPSFNVLNGVPSLTNKWLMKQVLQEEWKFCGIVISDYNAVAELVAHGVAEDKKEATRMAFENGCCIDMCSNGYITSLKELIEEGTIPEKELDKRVAMVLKLKDRLGLFEDPYRGASVEKEKRVCLTEDKRCIARKAAVESAVLLKNNGILPLSEKLEKVALIGPFADTKEILGFWACQGRTEESITVRQGIEALLTNAEVITVKGCGAQWDDEDKSGFAKALQVAKEAEVVILCLGEPQDYSGEGNCRTNLELPGVQKELVQQITEVNPNTVTLVFTGRPLVLKELEQQAAAILNMWFPGTEGGNAAAELLFGKANPSGKLSMSFPKSVGQCPVYYNHTNTGRPKKGEDDKRQGNCSEYIDCGNLPLYSFGHGLSYAKFVYENLSLSADTFKAGEKVWATISVRNDSPIDGKETVMLFMRDLVASNARPVQQLIAFEKVEIKAGEVKEVTFAIEEEIFRFWNPENAYVSEPGAFEISTGYADHLIHTKKLILE